MVKRAKLPNAISGLLKARDSYSVADNLSFLKDFRRFNNLGGNIQKVEPILYEKCASAGAASGHYFHQDLLVAKQIHDHSPNTHIDIGSRIDGFVAHVAAFRKIEILDIRPLESAGHPNIHFRPADLMQLDSKLIESSDSISCLHAIEHFGLGRYGDEVDPEGHIKGFQNLVAMIKPGGRLYISFPIATQSAVIFNKHRIFSPYDIFSWPTPGCTLKLIRFDYVDDDGNLHQNVNLNIKSIEARYACGIYTFEKLAGDAPSNSLEKISPAPYITFLMDPSNKEGAGSFYQRPFLASLMASALRIPFVMAANPHSDCHYAAEDHHAIEQDWEKIFSFLGPKVKFDNPLQNINLNNELIKGETYNAPFDVSYRFLNNLSTHQLKTLLNHARHQFEENIKLFPELYHNCDSSQGGDQTIIALHIRDRSKGDPPFSKKTLLDWQMFSRDYGLPDNNPNYYSRLYANAVNQIVRKNRIQNPVVRIHSTGEKNSFNQMLSLLDPNITVEFFLNADPPKSFLDLVFADYLIASHSSFSWLASLLRKGPTFMRRKFRHFVSPETEWIDEVLYDNVNGLQKTWLQLNMKLQYQLLKWR